MKEYNFKPLEDENIPYPVGYDMSKVLRIHQELIKAIEKFKFFKYNEFINLWCRGSSGAILSTLLSTYLISINKNVKVCHVKKDGEISHATTIHLHRDALNIIVDDFVYTGTTIKAIIDQMACHRVYPRGIILYGDSDTRLATYIDKDRCNFILATGY